MFEETYKDFILRVNSEVDDEDIEEYEDRYIRFTEMQLGRKLTDEEYYEIYGICTD